MRKSKQLYNELVTSNKAVWVRNLNNPVRFNNDDTVTIFCYGHGKIYSCLIDKDDLEKVSFGYSWNARVRKESNHIIIKNSSFPIYYYIMDRKHKNMDDGLVVDHINGNTQDNRKSNLRVVKPGKNMLNKNKYKNTTHRNIVKMNNYYRINIIRRFYDLDLAIEARNEINKILDKYSLKDLKYR